MSDWNNSMDFSRAWRIGTSLWSFPDRLNSEDKIIHKWKVTQLTDYWHVWQDKKKNIKYLNQFN